MKLTTKTVKTECEEIVCELNQEEFENVCAETAARTIADFIGDEPDADDIGACLALTHLFAEFTAHLVSRVFKQDADKSNQSNKTEKQEEN